MKKKILIPFIVLLVIIVALVLVYNSDWFYSASEQQKRNMSEIDAANSIIWYYGDLDPGKEVTINCKKISEFNEETIGDKDEEYVYHAIVIYDFDGEMNISDEELLLIKDYCENKYYDLLYYGTEHLEQFYKNGYFTQLDESNAGFAYNGSYWMNRSKDENYLNPYLLTGNWKVDNNNQFDTDDEHYMWKFTIDFIAGMIEDSNGI